MKEFPEWKIVIAEGVKKVERHGTGQYKRAVRVYTKSHEVGEAVLAAIQQNIRQIPPGWYNSVSGVAYNCRDFTIHWDESGSPWTFCDAINNIITEYGDYVNMRGQYAPDTKESSGGDKGKDGEDGEDNPNKIFTIVIVIFVAAIGYYLWKQAK